MIYFNTETRQFTFNSSAKKFLKTDRSNLNAGKFTAFKTGVKTKSTVQGLVKANASTKAVNAGLKPGTPEYNKYMKDQKAAGKVVGGIAGIAGKTLHKNAGNIANSLSKGGLKLGKKIGFLK